LTGCYYDEKQDKAKDRSLGIRMLGSSADGLYPYRRCKRTSELS